MYLQVTAIQIWSRDVIVQETSKTYETHQVIEKHCVNDVEECRRLTNVSPSENRDWTTENVARPNGPESHA